MKKNKSNSSRKKYILLGALGLLACGSIGGTLAYWASTINGTVSGGTGDVNIGGGAEVNTTLAVVNASNSQILVPAGRADATMSEVESVELLFKVNWSSDDKLATGVNGSLSATYVSAVSTESITDAQKAIVSRLINVSFDAASYAIVTDGQPVGVIATISITEPANKSEYDLVANSIISLNFNFSVAVI